MSVGVDADDYDPRLNDIIRKIGLDDEFVADIVVLGFPVDEGILFGQLIFLLKK